MIPTISYIVLLYNQEDFVAEAIGSAFAQEGPGIEIIISDDASSDGTYEAAKRHVDKYNGPHTVKINRNEKNMGIIGNAQKAYEMSSGEWIVSAGGDDLSQKNRVSKIREVIISTPGVKAISSGYSMCSSAGVSIPVSEKWLQSMQRMQDWSLTEMLRAACRGRPVFSMLGAATAWHRDLFEKFPPLSTAPRNVSEDSVLRWRALLLGKVRIIPEKLVVYRRTSSSVTHIDSGASRAQKKIHRQELLNRALQGYIFSKKDFVWALQQELAAKEIIEPCVRFMDHLVGYQKAQIEYPDASMIRKMQLLLSFGSSGLWRLALKRV